MLFFSVFWHTSSGLDGIASSCRILFTSRLWSLWLCICTPFLFLISENKVIKVTLCRFSDVTSIRKVITSNFRITWRTMLITPGIVVICQHLQCCPAEIFLGCHFEATMFWMVLDFEPHINSWMKAQIMKKFLI